MGQTSVYLLPWPELPDVADGPDAYEKLARATEAGMLSAAASPWVSAPARAPYTGNVLVRKEGACARLLGSVQGSSFTGSPTIVDIPVGYRPIFPAGSGITYAQFILPSTVSGVTAQLIVRVWANGAITVVALTNSSAGFDLGSVNYSIKNG